MENLLLPWSKKKKEEKKKEKKEKIKKMVGKKGWEPKQRTTFNFWYCNRKAADLAEFELAIKEIPLKSIEHHAKHNDFSNWLKDNATPFKAAKVKRLERKLKGEELRKKLIKAL